MSNQPNTYTEFRQNTSTFRSKPKTDFKIFGVIAIILGLIISIYDLFKYPTPTTEDNRQPTNTTIKPNNKKPNTSKPLTFLFNSNLLTNTKTLNNSHANDEESVLITQQLQTSRNRIRI